MPLFNFTSFLLVYKITYTYTCTDMRDGSATSMHNMSYHAAPCPEGVTVVNCLRDPCDGASCGGVSGAHCVSDYCGGCNARWYNDDDEEVTNQCRSMCSILAHTYTYMCLPL